MTGRGSIWAPPLLEPTFDLDGAHFHYHVTPMAAELCLLFVSAVRVLVLVNENCSIAGLRLVF